MWWVVWPLQCHRQSFVAIPEVAGAELRRTMRMAESSDEVLHQASNLKADKNAELYSTKGDICSSSSFSNFTNEYIHSSFSSIGINLGSDVTSIRNSVLELKKVEKTRSHQSTKADWKLEIVDKELKNMVEEEAIDAFILDHLCGEKMDEVMDDNNDLNDFTMS